MSTWLAQSFEEFFPSAGGKAKKAAPMEDDEEL